jgi:hypothetical protein
MIVRRNELGVRQEFQTSIIEYTSDNPSDNEQTFTSNSDPEISIYLQQSNMKY